MSPPGRTGLRRLIGDGYHCDECNEFPPAIDPSISGWEVLLRQLNPLTGSMQVPWLFENLVRILSLNDVQQARAKRNLADVYIRPPVEQFNILGFGAYDEIIEIGYETARRQIEQWSERPERVQTLSQ